jgi:hypothetical protein
MSEKVNINTMYKIDVVLLLLGFVFLVLCLVVVLTGFSWIKNFLLGEATMVIAIMFGFRARLGENKFALLLVVMWFIIACLFVVGGLLMLQ